MAPIRIVVADDHSLFRRGVVAAISAQPGMEVVGEAANGREAVEVAKKLHPDVVLSDLSMPEMSGVEVARHLRQEAPQINIIILTISDKEEDLFNAIKAGAKGYLLKEANSEELVRTITHVAEGGVIISPAMAPRFLTEIGTKTGPAIPEVSVLSPRETEILQFIAEGLTDKEIAERLFISLNTAKTHLKNILAKLQVKSRTQAAAYHERQNP